MNIDIYVLFGILTCHWVFDFIFQTSWQSENKSKRWDALLYHTLVYSWFWFIVSVIYIAFTFEWGLLWFAPITFVCHTITDYFTSRWTSKLYREKKVHKFFCVIGFDQLLHYIQLVLTFYYLTVK